MNVQPPGYNPSETLLQGGVATITPLMGGGGFIETNASESLLQGGNSADIIPLSGGAPKIQILKASTETLPDHTADLGALIKEYIKRKLKLWSLKSIRKQSSSRALPRYPIIPKKAPKKRYTEGVTMFDRFTCVLPETTKTIVVFESVNGNIYTYMKCIDYIYKRGYQNAKDAVLIFSPPFFNTEQPSKDASILLSHFLKMKQDSAALWFMLAEHTNGNIAAGYTFHTYQENPKYLVNMLEPTYIVYPYTVNDKNGILFSGATENEVIVPTSKDPNYMSIGNYVLDNGSGCFAYRPAIHKLDLIFDNYDTYRFIGKESYILNNNVIVISLSLVKEDKGNIDRFVASNQAKEIENVRDIELSTGVYKLRYPSETVRNDWWNRIFTEPEANILNDLNLSATMLEKVFGTHAWKTALVEFLQSLVISNCYKDTSILETSACHTTSKFVEKILVYYLMNDPNIVQRKISKTVSKEVLTPESTAAPKVLEEVFGDTPTAEPVITTEPLQPPKGTGNPFDDGVVRIVSPNDLSCEYYKTKKGEYKRQVLVIEKETDKTQWAEVLFSYTEEQEDALDATFQRKLDELRSIYKKWSFTEITDEDCNPKPF